MASTVTTDSKEIVAEIPSYIRVFNDGTVERPRQAPTVPPNLNDPQTGVSSKDIIISQNPKISARLYLPKLTNPLQKLPILVFFHGGGFFFESAFSKLYHHHFNIFVQQTNVIVVSVEYRLAPEHPLPAGYDDCWVALQWVASQSSNKNTDTETEPWLINNGDFNKVFIGGDSADQIHQLVFINWSTYVDVSGGDSACGNIVHNIAMRAGTEDLPGNIKILGAILQHPFFYSSYPIGSESVKSPDEKKLYYSVWDFVYPSAPNGIDNPMVNPVGPGAPSLSELGCSRIIVCVAGKDGIRDRGVWYYELVKNSEWNGKIELFEEKEEDHVYHIFYPESENGEKLIKRLASFIHE